MKHIKAWEGFKGQKWKEEINIQDFIAHNYTEYLGDETFLEDATEATTILNTKFNQLRLQEMAQNGVLDVDTDIV